MKQCPVCNRSYTDESQNFCLEDGATLIASGASGFASMPSPTQSWQPNAPQNFAAAPRKKSRTWLWVLGILGVVVVVGFVGFFGLLIAIGIAVDNANNDNGSNVNTRYNSNSGSKSNTNGGKIVSNANVGGSSNTAKPAANLKYSEMDWGKIDSAVGFAEYVGNEYRVNSKSSNNYYVIIVAQTVKDEFVTKNAVTKITARPTSNEISSHGFGLVVHSDPVPLSRDYAFIIRTGKDAAYRIVKHENKQETEIVNWTPASYIRTGTQANELEVRSNGKTLEFYINGQFATSIPDNISGKGIVGLYTSGTSVVAFSDLKIYENK